MKNDIGIFIEIALILNITLGKRDILNINYSDPVLNQFCNNTQLSSILGSLDVCCSVSLQWCSSVPINKMADYFSTFRFWVNPLITAHHHPLFLYMSDSYPLTTNCNCVLSSLLGYYLYSTLDLISKKADILSVSLLLFMSVLSTVPGVLQIHNNFVSGCE